jgi:hypothetical protein
MPIPASPEPILVKRYARSRLYDRSGRHPLATVLTTLPPSRYETDWFATAADRDGEDKDPGRERCRHEETLSRCQQ